MFERSTVFIASYKKDDLSSVLFILREYGLFIRA